MTTPVDIAWLERLGDSTVTVDGLMRVADYTPVGRPPEEVVMMEKGADLWCLCGLFRRHRP